MLFFTLERTINSVLKGMSIPLAVLYFHPASAESNARLTKPRNILVNDTTIETTSSVTQNTSTNILGVRMQSMAMTSTDLPGHVSMTDVSASAIADFAAPDPVCAGSQLTMPTPTVKDNGNTILKTGWLLNDVEFDPATIMKVADNGSELKYYVETVCGRVTSTPVNVAVNQAPEIAAITNPAAICSGSLLSLSNPAITTNGSSIVKQGWQLDGAYFDPSTTPLTYADITKKLTYNVESGCGSVPSAVVPFSINQAPKIAAIADPGPICSGTVLSLSNPAIIDNGSSIIRQGWQLNGADYSPSTPLTYADNGGKLVYSAENGCGIITSNEIIVKVNQAPEIAAIIPPSPICANSSLVLTAPAVNPNGASIINKGWQLDGVYFDPSTTLLTFADNIKKLKYNVESGCGNIPSPLVLFTVNQAPDIAAIAAPAAICEGSPLTLADPAVAVNGSTIINKEGWQLNGKYFNPSTPLTYADNDKNLTYKVESSCGNVPSNGVKVTIFPLPQVTLPNELIASADERTTLTPEIKGTIVKYVWLPEEGLSCYDCETPVFQFKKSSNYKLTVESSDGCRASSSIAIKLMERFMPNAFSPDGNGINDRFTVTGQNIKLVKSFRIYNRFGNLVFIRSNIHPNDSNNGWDGTVDGKPVNQTTTFAYAIEYVNNEGNSKIEKGTVMLIR